MKPIFVGLSLFTTLVSFAPFAVADETPAKVVRTELVSYADLDTDTTAGARTLYSRLNGAARQVCGAQPDLRNLREARAVRECRERAVNGAVAKIDSEQLRALHARESDGVTVASTVKAHTAR